MNAIEARPETAAGHVDRRNVLRCVAAIVASGLANAALDMIPTHYLLSRVGQAFAESAFFSA